MFLKENPDTVYLPDGQGGKEKIYYVRPDAISFLMYEDGFTVYAKSENLDQRDEDSFFGHNQLATIFLASQFDPSSLSPSDIQKIKYIKTIGQPSGFTKSLMGNLSSFYTNTHNVIRGRFWIDSKVLSYWDTPLIKNRDLRKKIGELIQKVGENPSEYKFEVQDDNYQSNFLSYKEFLNLQEDDSNEAEREYVLGNKVYKSSDLNDLRVSMHLKTGWEKDLAISKLCTLLDDEALQKYPELQGFLPPDCSKVKDADDQIKSYLAQGKPEFTASLQKSLSPDRGWNKGTNQPIKTTTFSPSDEIGKLPGSSPFRARTQKELDRAWDLLKQNNKNPSFKEWLQILENLL